MNLLFINSFDCSPESTGGVNRIVYVLSRRLTKDYGYRCFLAYYEDNPARPLAEFCGRIKLDRHFDDDAFEQFVRNNSIDVIQVNFLKKHNLPTIANIYRIATRNNIKVIYAFHMCPGFQAVTYGSWEMVRYSVSHQVRAWQETRKWLLTLSAPILRPFSDLLLRKKYRYPYVNCDHVVLLSKHYYEPYMRIAGISDTGKFSAIGNALTFESFIDPDRIPKKQKEVIVVARFDEDTKRVSFSLKVWRMIEQDARWNDWKLTLIGEGRDMAYYKYLVKKWHLQRVTFTGLQAPQAYYERASVFLMTSSAEGWPMVLNEAAQMGVVTIAFDSFGSIHDIIEDGYNGRLVPNNDVKALYDALCDVMGDDAMRETLSVHAVTSSHRFEIDKIEKRWNDLYTSLLCDKRLKDHE